MTSYRLKENHTIYEVRNDKRKRNNVRHMLMQLFACASFAVHRRHCFSRARELTRVFVLFLSEQFVQIGEFLANCRSWFRRHSPKSMYNYATRDHARTRRNFAECLLVCVQMNHMVERSCVPVSMKHFRMWPRREYSSLSYCFRFSNLNHAEVLNSISAALTLHDS